MIRWFAAFVVVTASVLSCRGQSPASCQFYKVSVPSLNISPEPRGDSTYIDVLDNGDVACVTRDQRVGDRDWSFIAYVVKGSERRTVEGWANRQGLQPTSSADAGASPGTAGPAAKAPVVPASPAQQQEGAAPAPSPPSSQPPNGGEAVKWGAPIPFGPLPVNGQTIEQLARGQPLFAPIEGLDESFWKTGCGACHQWTRSTLCGQGQLYVADPRKILRIKHPYGGAYKLALWRWAKAGCN